MVENWRARAKQAGGELEREVLRSPVLERALECAMRLVLGAALSAGELFGGYAPFGVGLVACSGSGVDGLCALIGAGAGYLLFRGLVEGIRYAAACVLVYSVAFAFYDLKIYQTAWFMPLVASAMDAVTGFVYLSDAHWRPASVAFFATEVILAGASACFFRLALDGRALRREGSGLDRRRAVSAVFLLDAALVSLAPATFFGDLSLGRCGAVLAVLAAAWAGGMGCGAAVGVALGLGMDLSSAVSAPVYAMAYGLSGLLTGAGWKQGRLFGALTYVVSNAAAALWLWDAGGRVSMLYEAFIASVLFLLLPPGALRRLRSLLAWEGEGAASRRVLACLEEKLSRTAGAFRALQNSLRSAFPENAPSGGDPAAVFDRAARRTCGKCALRGTCWERDCLSTYNALNNALPALLEKGRGEAADFPGWFSGRCVQFAAFLQAVNEELTALRYRKQYQSRIRESRREVCRQYGTLADVLAGASAELSAELTADPVRERKLRQHLDSLGLEGECCVYCNEAGRLRLEVDGERVERLTTAAQVAKLSELMGLPLRPGQGRPGRAVLVQAEPLMAVAGVAARRREGQRESGDTGTWFKREDGSLFVLLCDGMGSGEAAHRESALAVRLLESFLRSGLDSAAALRTVNSALALKNEEAGAFATVDLLRVDLYTGAGEVCKLGAAPTYVRKGGAVSRLAGSTLPAGLAAGGSDPDVTGLELKEGDWILLLSDGVADAGDDGWVREKLASFDGSPKDLAREVMEESERRVGAVDDRTAVVLTLKKRA